MDKFFIQLYGDIDDLCNSRIIDELDYYMYDVKSKREMIFYFTKEQSIYLVLNDDTDWTIQKLQTLCRTALRENNFILIPLNNYSGYMYMSIQNNMKKTCVEFFEKPKAYRKLIKRGNKISKLKTLIKRFKIPNSE
jgi:hypothetical protein